MIRLIEDRAGPSDQWTEQLSSIHVYLGQYLGLNGEHPENGDPYEINEMEKLFWKFPMIVAGMQAAAESFLPVWTLFNSKLRGQHGSGISALEPKILERYRHMGETDGKIFQNIVNDAFRLNRADVR